MQPVFKGKHIGKMYDGEQGSRSSLPRKRQFINSDHEEEEELIIWEPSSAGHPI